MNSTRVFPEKLPTPASQFIPHSGSMLLIDELLQSNSSKSMGNAIIKQTNPFLRKDKVLSDICFIEILAQTVAAANGYNRHKDGKPAEEGFLVGIENFIFFKTASEGDLLLLKLEKTSEMQGISFVEGEVLRGPETLAKGTIKLFSSTEKRPLADVSTSNHPKKNIVQFSFIDNKENALRLDIRKYIEEIQVIDLDRLKCHCQFSPDFLGFQGHFPEQPIFPGVGMVEISTLLAEELTAHPIKLSQIEKIKFMKVILSDMPISISIQIFPKDPDGPKIHSEITGKEGKIATFILKYKNE